MRGFSLALSGGGLLGAAHLGALKFLEEKRVHAQAVAGTSAGGLVAALYGLNVPMDQVIAAGREVSQHPTRYFHLNTGGLIHEIWRGSGPPATGLIKPQPFLDRLLRLAPHAKNTADWTIPTVLTSVDLVSLQAIAFTNRPKVHPRRGRWQVLTNQPLFLAMQATMALPGLFEAPRPGDRVLVDGGTADTLPIDWAYALYADRVVAIDVATPPLVSAVGVGLAEVLSRSESYATDTLSRLRAGREAHITVRPDTQHVAFLGFKDYDRLVEAGWIAMENAWPSLDL